jgi:hypothetical protein
MLVRGEKLCLHFHKPLHTIEEYLAFERIAEERHEYLDGVIYAMAGERPALAKLFGVVPGRASSDAIPARNKSAWSSTSRARCTKSASGVILVRAQRMKLRSSLRCYGCLQWLVSASTAWNYSHLHAPSGVKH